MSTVSSTTSPTSTTATSTTAASTGTSSGTTTTGSSDPSSVGSSLVTALGLGTGIDMTNLATQISAATYASTSQYLANQLSAVQVQISEASQLQSDMANLVSSLGTLVGGGSLAASPTVANSSVATASLPPGQTGASTSYSLEVSHLASGQVLTSPAFASASATTGSGTLTFTFGTTTASSTGTGSTSSFAADASQSPLSVTIHPGDTLNQIAQDINSAGGAISAYVANTAQGARLVMQGESGANAAFTVSASEASGDPGLSALNWEPSTGAASQLAVSASDARFTLNGIAQTSASNTIANAAPGLSLQLTGTNAGNPTTITYSNPASAITNAMTNLTSALNSIVSEVNTDRTPSASGSLTNDGGARALAGKLAQLAGTTIMPHAASGAPSTLADLGLVVGKDGTFTLNSAKLQSALSSNPGAVAAMFTDGLYGIYGTLSDISMAASSSTDPGSLAGSVTYYTRQQTQLKTRQSAIATQQANLRSQLISQLGTANASVATSKSTLTFLQNQIAAWNKTGSTGG